MKENACCFIGHRKTEETEALTLELRKTVENLITEDGVDTFLFGSKSGFNDVCYTVVTELKESKPPVQPVVSACRITPNFK